MHTPIPKENLESEFRNMATELIHNNILRTPEAEYILAEIEFYLFHPNHPDNSTHCDERQKLNGFWYLHRYKNSEKFKSGKRKGIDITFGNKSENIYAGILIRAIQNRNQEDDYFYGPSNVVDRIIDDSKCTNEDIESKNIFENPFLKLIPAKPIELEILACPRHNLGKDTLTNYLKLGYRFITFPVKQHSGKESVIIPFLKDKISEQQILKLFNRKTI